MNQSLIYRVLNVAELLPVDDSGTNWLMMMWTFFFWGGNLENFLGAPEMIYFDDVISL